MSKKILWKTFSSVHFHNQTISVYSVLVYPFPTVSFNFIICLQYLIHFIQSLFTFSEVLLQTRFL